MMSELTDNKQAAKPELLPCPFCGSEPGVLMPTGKIYCFADECPCGPEVHAPVIGPFQWDYDAMYEAWNTRWQSRSVSQQLAAQSALLQRVREKLEKWKCNGCNGWGGFHMQRCEQCKGTGRNPTAQAAIDEITEAK